MKVCSVGASWKLGGYMVQHALDRGHEVVGVCPQNTKSVGKLAAFEGRITILPGATDDRAVVEEAVAGWGGVLTVLVPMRGLEPAPSALAQRPLRAIRVSRGRSMVQPPDR